MKNGWIRRLCSGSLMLLALVFLAGCGDDDDDGGVVAPPTFSISGQVTSTGAGLSGVTMTLSGASSATATTDAGGNYAFAGLDNGSYTVTPSRTGFTFSPTDNTQTVSGADITGVDFTATATVVTAVITKVAALDNTQETTGSDSTGKGGGILTVDTATGRASGFVVSTGVDNVTAAHIHSAARGVQGDVIVPLVGGPDIWVVPDNTILTPANVTDFQNGDLYYNIHNIAFSVGAIRGQLDMTPTEIKFAALDNTQETTGSDSTGKGGGFLAVDTATGRAAGFSVSTGVDNVTVAHIHSAARGVQGDVIVPLVGGPDIWVVPDNTTLTPANVTGFQNGDLYYNIHNIAFSVGAIRGQLDFP
ncbi:MAG: CHRD domain-containing protein [Deltaproteobacteria bacterium]|nr:CHRD domain-containing protein [Deltaproteobacteria bacterium]